MSEGLFRKEALARFMRIDSPGAILSIAPPRTKVVFGVMLALFAALTATAVFGHAQIVAEGRGIVRPDQPPIVLRAPFAGTVLAIEKASSDRASKGEPILELDTSSEAGAMDSCSASIATEQRELASLEQRLLDWNQTGKGEAAVALVLVSQMRTQRDKVTSMTARCDALATTVAKGKVSAPVDATVTDVAVSAGAHVQQGDILATIEPATARLVGYMQVPETQRGEISIGQSVRLKLDSLPFDEVGAGSAHITHILDALPSSVRLEPRSTEDRGGGVVLEVAIDTMPANAPVRAGLTFTGEVATRRVSVARLLFGSSSRE